MLADNDFSLTSNGNKTACNFLFELLSGLRCFSRFFICSSMSLISLRLRKAFMLCVIPPFSLRSSGFFSSGCSCGGCSCSAFSCCPVDGSSPVGGSWFSGCSAAGDCSLVGRSGVCSGACSGCLASGSVCGCSLPSFVSSFLALLVSFFFSSSFFHHFISPCHRLSREALLASISLFPSSPAPSFSSPPSSFVG